MREVNPEKKRRESNSKVSTEVQRERSTFSRAREDSKNKRGQNFPDLLELIRVAESYNLASVHTFVLCFGPRSLSEGLFGSGECTVFEGSVGEKEPFIQTSLHVLLSTGEDEVNMGRELMAVEDGLES